MLRDLRDGGVSDGEYWTDEEQEIIYELRERGLTLEVEIRDGETVDLLTPLGRLAEKLYATLHESAGLTVGA